ncbi:MAG: hypothetical protein ACRC37_01805 [Lentisphaeria bacterium]
MKRFLILMALASLIIQPVFSACNKPDEDPDNCWVKGPALQGIGDIIRVDSGPSANRLHYRNTTTDKKGSIAYFEINLDAAKDYDLNTKTGELRDAGVDRTNVAWRCEPEYVGSMEEDGDKATFRPSTELHSNIKIYAKVSENKTLSYACGDPDSPVEKQYTETLQTFKVGLRMTPGSIEFWEDDSLEKKTILVSELNCSMEIPWTGYFYEGQIEKPTIKSGLKEVSWIPIATSPNSEFESIPGKISYNPQLICEGEYYLAGTMAGFQNPGMGAAVEFFIKLLSAANPYVGAAVELTVKLNDNNQTSYYGAIVAESVMENVDKKTVDIRVYNDYWRKYVNLSNLSIDGKIEVAAPNIAKRASISLAAVIGVNDEGILNEAEMRIFNYFKDTKEQLPHFKAEMVTTRPTYQK